ncbi:hypothetical protein BC828DRAFT_385490 [Blastocladiella britannica]|nr:hypothetical protein BC828DRAFT_385490 [Blastocladiella britannica]
MGNASSKPAPEPMVFHSDISVRFNEGLIRKLEDNVDGSSAAPSSEPPVVTASHASAPATTAHTGPSAADVEAFVQAEVARRVNHELEMRRTVDGSRVDNRSELDSTTALRDADELLQRLGRVSLPTPEPSMECIVAQEQLVSCFRANKTRPLDCWKEVQQFKSSLKKVQKEFMDSAALL